MRQLPPNPAVEATANMLRMLVPSALQTSPDLVDTLG